MSAIVKLRGKLPADDSYNGLDATVRELLDKPETVRVALVTYFVDQITETPADDVRVPTIYLNRFEPVGTTSDVEQAIRDALSAAVRKRTGQEELDLDVVESVEGGYVGDED